VVLDAHTDVLVVGGGLAGTWTALGAARAGASVLLVDKGFCGTSGVTATAGVGHWWVDPAEREQAIAARLATAAGLAEEEWMARILETTWENLPGIGKAFRFPVDDGGRTRYRTARGPEYLRAMRRLVQEAGVRILDHHPALELLVHPDGSVGGAAGITRQPPGRWRVEAGAVVLAAGGCGWKSRLLGSHNNTGDGALMAVEAGAELSGMELSGYYTVAPAGSTMTRSMSYLFGAYCDGDGRPLDFGGGEDFVRTLARALLRGPVYATLERMPAEIREHMPQVQPNFMLPFDRRRIDPYRDRFEVTLHGEGTIRGVGGVRVTDQSCSTGVPGLFVAGDTASRERVAGAVSGGGAQNSAWALSSGLWAGAAAARHAATAGRRAPGADASALRPAGTVGVRPAATQGAPGPATTRAQAIVAAVQGEVHPLDKNLFRTESGLRRSLAVLDDLWTGPVQALGGRDDDPLAALRDREAAAMTAHARWSYTAALARTESRGLHVREDLPATDPLQARRLLVAGLDRVRVRPDGTPSDQEGAAGALDGTAA
jgi:succinate dehydrogenase/fumarate reductase flavoprotein subunit